MYFKNFRFWREPEYNIFRIIIRCTISVHSSAHKWNMRSENLCQESWQMVHLIKNKQDIILKIFPKYNGDGICLSILRIFDLFKIYELLHIQLPNSSHLEIWLPADNLLLSLIAFKILMMTSQYVFNFLRCTIPNITKIYCTDKEIFMVCTYIRDTTVQCNRDSSKIPFPAPQKF